MQSDRKFLAHPHVIYKKSDKKTLTDKNRPATEWAVWTQVNGKNSIEDIATILATDSKKITAIIQMLFMDGVVEVAQVKKIEKNYVPETFFQDMEQILTSIVGPVAPFVIEDTISDNELSKNKFLKAHVPELIEMISDEIYDEDKKVKFQAEMLEYIKNKLA